MAGATCEHGFRVGACKPCWTPRKIDDLFDAWVIHRSGFGSFVEWADCADIFFANQLYDEADFCSVKAIDSLGKLPGMPEVKWRAVVSVFIRGRLAPVANNAKSRLSFLAVADRLNGAKSALGNLRAQWGGQSKATSVLSQADVELSESILLARDSAPHSRVQLAAKFRKYNRFSPRFKWDRPDIAVGLMNEHLSNYPTDVAALVVRASACGDLGFHQDGLLDAKAALLLAPNDIFALITAGRLLLGIQDGFEAWVVIEKAYKIKPSLPTAAMLLISCAIARMAPNLTQSHLELISTRRAQISSEIASLSTEHDRAGQANLDRIVIQMLIFDLQFIEVITFVKEIQNEGHLGNHAHWNTQIDQAILRAGLSVQELRVAAEQIVVDVFPD